jgi:hypothetical protein
MKRYEITLDIINACNFSQDEWNNLFWDVDEEPNSSDEGINVKYYDFVEGFDPVDPALLEDPSKEVYYLDVYDEMAGELYPSVAKLLKQNPKLCNLHTQDVVEEETSDEEEISFKKKRIPSDEELEKMTY